MQFLIWTSKQTKQCEQVWRASLMPNRPACSPWPVLPTQSGHFTCRNVCGPALLYICGNGEVKQSPNAPTASHQSTVCVCVWVCEEWEGIHVLRQPRCFVSCLRVSSVALFTVLAPPPRPRPHPRQLSVASLLWRARAAAWNKIRTVIQDVKELRISQLVAYTIKY